MRFIGLHTSDKPEKKYYVDLEGDTGRKKRVYFGSAGMTDYTKDNALTRDDRRRRYLLRHRKMEDWSDPSTAGFWSRWILWEKPTIRAALASVLRRFPSLSRNT
jgi:hypothetical protein